MLNVNEKKKAVILIIIIYEIIFKLIWNYTLVMNSNYKLC